MQSKLEGWKTKYLALVGSNALAQSILAAIPQYTAQSTMVPRMLCNRIDKMIRGFIWDDLEGKKRVHLINWETITRTKDQGGLGIKTLHGMNLAFMAKIGWRLITDKGSLWSQVIAGKYMRGEANITKLTKKIGTSNLWKGVTEAAHILSTGLRRKVYNGEDTLFWRDTWLGEGPLINMALHPLPLDESFKTVKDYWTSNSNWN